MKFKEKISAVTLKELPSDINEPWELRTSTVAQQRPRIPLAGDRRGMGQPTTAGQRRGDRITPLASRRECLFVYP